MTRIDLNLDGEHTRVVVTLSERNLIALLTKLYTPESAAMIGIGDAPPGVEAFVAAETDELHYSSDTRRGIQAGPMVPLSESIMREVRAAVHRIMAGTDSPN